MHKLRLAVTVCALLCTAALLVPSASASSGHPPKKKALPSGAPLARRMISALQAESRIQAVGAMTTHRITTHYLFRYQSSGREYLQERGGSFRVQVGKRHYTSIMHTEIGNQAYTSLDGKRWYRTPGHVSPAALDALALNSTGVTCCAVGKRSGATLTKRGTRSWHGRRVEVLGFKLIASAQIATGAVLVDPTTYRPLYYNSTTYPTGTRAAFTLTYGGKFTIPTPH